MANHMEANYYVAKTMPQLAELALVDFGRADDYGEAINMAQLSCNFDGTKAICEQAVLYAAATRN